MSPFRAFVALILFAMGRHAKLRAMGLAGFALLAVLALVVGLVTHRSGGWRLEKRLRTVQVPEHAEPPLNSKRMTYEQYGEERLPFYAMMPGSPSDFAAKAIAFAPFWAAINPGPEPDQRKFLDDWAFLNFAKWAVFILFIAFLLPLLTLAYASGSFGTEREDRTLIWMTTRPLPRWAIYLAKLLATIPWTLGAAGLGFGTLCIVGGDYGGKAAGLYWPSVLGATVALTALFHFLGAAFPRPTVVGLVYIFFFETLVSNLPGSLKQLSVSYYVRSLFYNATASGAGGVQPESLAVYNPVTSATAWGVLLGVTVALSVLGAVLFERQERFEET